jgi:hypothetical protein
MNTHGTGMRMMAFAGAAVCSLRARRDSAVQRPVKSPHSSAEIGIAASTIKMPFMSPQPRVNTNLGDYAWQCHGLQPHANAAWRMVAAFGASIGFKTRFPLPSSRF